MRLLKHWVLVVALIVATTGARPVHANSDQPLVGAIEAQDIALSEHRMFVRLMASAIGEARTLCKTENLDDRAILWTAVVTEYDLWITNSRIIDARNSAQLLLQRGQGDWKHLDDLRRDARRVYLYHDLGIRMFARFIRKIIFCEE